MPIAKVQMPDGRVVKVEVPEGTTPEQATAYVQEQVAKADEHMSRQQTPDEFIAQTEQSMQQEPQDRGFGERLGRAPGLYGRAALEGAGELAGVFTNPVTYLANKIPGVNLDTTAGLASRGADAMNMPVPETQNERLASEAVKWMTPAGISAKTANVVSRGGSKVAETLARAPGAQLSGAAGGGVASQYVEDTGGPWHVQLAAGLAGGFGGAAAPAVATKVINGVRGAVNSLRGTQASIANIEAMLNEALAPSGITLNELHGSVRSGLLREMEDALRMGREVDPNVIRRLGDHAMVGTTPIRSTVTLNPAHVTQEKNLAKIGAQSQDENLQRLSQIQHENDQTLTRNLNELGAGTERTAFDTGTRIKTALQLVDDQRPAASGPSKQVVDRAYEAVRMADGRYANIDTRSFSTAANNALDENQLGYVLPTEARAWLNSVSDGTIPLNVNTMQQSDSMLSGLQRAANRRGESQQALAIGHVRTALGDAPIETAAGQRAVDLYNRARTLARERFRLIEENPAMRAALDDADPDKFMQNFVLGTGKDASVSSVRALGRDLRMVPEAFQAARENILYYIKGKAIGANADETANFSAAGYNRVIKAIGIDKLRVFFSPQEVRRLQAVGRVAGYEKFQPTGAAVNNSNTGPFMFMSFMEKVVTSPVARHLPILKHLASVSESAMQTQRHRVGAGEALNPSILRPPVAQPRGSVMAPLAVPLAADYGNQ